MDAEGANQRAMSDGVLDDIEIKYEFAHDRTLSWEN